MKTQLILTLAIFLFSGSINAQDSNNIKATKNILRKNSIYFEVFGVGLLGSINYDRILPISKKTGIILRGGLNYKPFPLGETDVFIGGPSNFFEFGFGNMLFRNILFHHDLNYPMLRIGYRFQGSKGLLIRAAYLYVLRGYKDIEGFLPGVTFGNNLFCGLSIGYSF